MNNHHPDKHTQNTECVIVFGVESQIGLNIVRELGKHQCRVVAVGKSQHSIGLHSRYATYRYSLEQPLSDDHIAQQLRHISEETGANYLLCVSEGDILLMNRLKERLAPLIPLVPEDHIMQRVLDKSTTIGAAEKLGIATPRSLQIESVGDLQDVVTTLHFPVILKWSNPNAHQARAHRLGIQLDKLLYINTVEELQAKMQYYSPIGAFPLIQEYCPGYGVGQFFFMHEGEPLLRFQHRRVHEWPPEGGYSTLCQGLPMDQHPSLQQQSIKLLQALQWTGVAMVEYRFDPATQRAVLMEINGRFWGSYPLAFHSRVPFAWFTLQVLGLGHSPPPVSAKAGIKCRNLWVEMKRLYRIWFQPHLIQDKSLSFNKWKELGQVLSGFIDFRTRYYLWSLDDPNPVFYDLWKQIQRALPQVSKRLNPGKHSE